MLPLDKIFRCQNKFVITGVHPLSCQRSSILNFLLANFSPPRHLCRIILVCGPGMDHTLTSFRTVLGHSIDQPFDLLRAISFSYELSYRHYVPNIPTTSEYLETYVTGHILSD